MKKSSLLNLLSYTIIVLAFISATIGLFYSNGGTQYIVKNIYGQNVKLYGDGIYAFNSVLKAGAFKGTDIAILFMIPMLLITTIFIKNSKKTEFIHAGLLCCFMYYSSSLSFGVSYNRLFPIYLLLFSTSFFACILAVKNVVLNDNLIKIQNGRALKGTAIFIIIVGSSVLVWLTYIIPSIITGNPLSNIEIYTTEPTFIIDLGVVFPITLTCGIMLLKQKKLGYKLAPVLLTLFMMVGLCVICQTIVQLKLGINIPLQQIIGMVFTFVALGAISVILNIRFLKYIN